MAYRVPLCLGALAVILLLNLRGMREAGTVFAAPTYRFLVLVFGMIGWAWRRSSPAGWRRSARSATRSRPACPAARLQAVGLLLLLAAFASGCTALTGIEAISDGVPAFQQPESRNAARRRWSSLGVLLGSMFLGISFLADQVGVQLSATRGPFAGGPRRVRPLDGSARRGQSVLVVLQWATALILVLAANTSFADFPRLSFFLARDRYLPHQFASAATGWPSPSASSRWASLGRPDRGLQRRHDALLPLYAIGVFSSFTLSQTGMVVRWWRLRPPGWRRSALINGFGAATTLLVLLILCWTKFGEGQTMFTLGGLRVNAGAWIVIALVPVIALGFLRIQRHYERVSAALSLAGVDPAAGRRGGRGRALAGGRGGAAAPLRRLTHLLVMPIAG